MPSSPIRACAAALALLAGGAASAADPTASPAGGGRQIDCQSLAGGPNGAAMVERCKAQTAGMAELMQAMGQPGGERPGDERMTCEQIVAELKVVSGPGVSRANAIESVAAGKQLQETYDAQMAKGQTLMAAQTARTAAAAGIDLVTGTNVAGGGAAAQNAAEQAALQADAGAKMAAARARVDAANDRSRADLAASLRANPRMGRLMMLAANKNCSTP